MARSGTHESTRKSEKIVRRIPPAKVCAAEHDPYRAWARKTLTCVILTVAFTTGGSCWAGRSNCISPEVVNTHVIFSRVCSKVVYSSNRDGLVRPFVVEMKNPAEPK